METHRIHPELLKHKVRVLVVGCGGNEAPSRLACPTCIRHCWHTVIRKDSKSPCWMQTSSLRRIVYGNPSVDPRWAFTSPSSSPTG